ESDAKQTASSDIIFNLFVNIDNYLILFAARCILFLLIWLLTGGRHHFWFLPNLTADVGFIDSFRPLYTHEYKGPKSDSKKTDEETDPQKQPQPEGDEEKEVEEEETKAETTATAEVATGNLVRERQSDTDSDRRDDDGSQHSSGNGNDFEMITREELEQPTDDDEEEEEEEDDEEAQPLHSKS
ncbi:translocation protein SEC62-like, partial [Rhincodon typus]|uniref:translocation protein SEC62-like n=1 Tax=Rhincodon typus TaxID=259920 RepID=UPI00202E2AB4